MRQIATGIVFVLLTFSTILPAAAWPWSGDYAVTYRQHWHGRGASYSGLPAPCQQAARLGGPCGCWASIHFFGHSVRALWPVSQWLASFQRTSPRSGVAMIWPGRHVAPTVGEPHNGRILVQDSWATHEVSIAGKIFVDPRSPRGRQLASGK